MICPKDFKGSVRENEPLAGLTSWRIGGPACFLIEPESESDLAALVVHLKRKGACYRILGGGTNLLVEDGGVETAVLRLSSSVFAGMIFRGQTAELGAGLSLKKFVAAAMKQGLCGFEHLAGIPGSVGGAAVMNAGKGREGGSISDIIDSVRVMDCCGRISELPSRSIKFSYRASGLDDLIVLSVKIKLAAAADMAAVRKRVKDYAVYRIQTQDFTRPSAGCVFKNPDGDSAGRMLDACGLKGRRCGGAVFSKRHANFILNMGGASCADVLSLMDTAVSSVKERFGAILEPEVKLWR